MLPQMLAELAHIRPIIEVPAGPDDGLDPPELLVDGVFLRLVHFARQ
jgi:hypothetical protein